MCTLIFQKKPQIFPLETSPATFPWLQTLTTDTTRPWISRLTAEQIEICSVDTLAFPWENNDGRVKTNWYAPNLHIDWELHQASLMSPDFEDETGDYNEVTTQDHTWLFKSRAANMQTQSMVMFPPQICKQDCCLQMFKRWMLWSPNLNDNNFMSLQHDRTADRFFSASLFNEEKPK